MSSREAIPQGTLDMLILNTLSRTREMHGFEIAEAIERTSSDVFRVEEGSLYPALQRMLSNGWIVGEWGRTSGNRRARYYRTTAAGRQQLERERRAYQRVLSRLPPSRNLRELKRSDDGNDAAARRRFDSFSEAGKAAEELEEEMRLHVDLRGSEPHERHANGRGRAGCSTPVRESRGVARGKPG